MPPGNAFSGIQVNDVIKQAGQQVQLVQQVQAQVVTTTPALDCSVPENLTIPDRQQCLENNYINPDTTAPIVQNSISDYNTKKGYQDNTLIPSYNTDKSNIQSQASQTQELINYKNSIPKTHPFPGQEVTYDEKSLDPIRIIPFPDRTGIASNNFNITTPFYNQNDTYNEYNFKGTYSITSSSNQKDAYKAFTKSGIWKSDDKYKVTEYTSSYYTGSSKTTVKQEVINIPSATNNYGTTDIVGEWLQISLPADKPVYLFRYTITVPDPITTGQASYPTDRNPDESYTYPIPLPPRKKYTSQFPKSFTVVGSTDGKEWFYIDQRTFVEPPDLDLSNSDKERNKLNDRHAITFNSDGSISFELNSVNRYTFFRLIITELFPGNSKACITTWGLYGFVQNISPNIKTLESFSNQYVIGMSSNFGDVFSKDVDANLKKTYREQLTNLSEARNFRNPLSNLVPFVENFDNHGFIEYPGGTTNGNSVIKNQLNPTMSIYQDYLYKQGQINNNVYDLSQNIYNFSNNYSNLLKAPGDKYDMNNNNFNKPPTHLDGLISDNKEFIMQQNNIFILSTITITTLVLALIIVSK